MRSWKCGWNRYTEPSIPTVTLFSPILFNNVAIPALARCAALLDTNEHTYLTFSQSWSLTFRKPSSANTSRQFVYFPLGSLKQFTWVISSDFLKVSFSTNHSVGHSSTTLITIRSVDQYLLFDFGDVFCEELAALSEIARAFAAEEQAAIH